MIQSVTFELKPCVMIVTPPAVTEPVEQSASTNAPRQQRNRVLNADAAFTMRIFRLAFARASQPGRAEELAELFDEKRARATIAEGCTRTAERNREKRDTRDEWDKSDEVQGRIGAVDVQRSGRIPGRGSGHGCCAATMRLLGNDAPPALAATLRRRTCRPRRLSGP